MVDFTLQKCDQKVSLCTISEKVISGINIQVLLDQAYQQWTLTQFMG